MLNKQFFDYNGRLFPQGKSQFLKHYRNIYLNDFFLGNTHNLCCRGRTLDFRGSN